MHVVSVYLGNPIRMKWGKGERKVFEPDHGIELFMVQLLRHAYFQTSLVTAFATRKPQCMEVHQESDQLLARVQPNT